MNGITGISASALQAFSTAQQVTANNVANISTEEFKASATSFQSLENGGVSASVSSTNDTVDISREAVNLINNSQNFKANLKLLKVSDEMTRELLDIKV